MEKKDSLYKKIVNKDETALIFQKLWDGEILYLRKGFEDMLQDIEIAIELDNRKAFLEGLVSRFKYLGIEVEITDTEEMLAELKKRYKERIGTAVPRTVKEWVRGTTPGTDNKKDRGRKNHYELCYALEMDVNETAEFFVKSYLTAPYNYKDYIDAIFFYGLSKKKPYAVIKELLEKAKIFDKNIDFPNDTFEIGRNIAEIEDDEEFLNYLSENCYNNEQQCQKARKKIINLVEEIKEMIIGDIQATSEEYVDVNEERMINMLVDHVFGFNYQQNIKKNLKSQGSEKRYVRNTQLPKRFVESIPRDGVLGDIIKGKAETYETLRKTLIILFFYSFFHERYDDDDIKGIAKDFYEEVNSHLFECGFAPIYVRNPFDYLMIFCALSPDPTETFCELNNYRYIEK